MIATSILRQVPVVQKTWGGDAPVIIKDFGNSRHYWAGKNLHFEDKTHRRRSDERVGG